MRTLEHSRGTKITRGDVLLLALLVLSALAPVLFRLFLTLDGPMHVLHACVAKAAWLSDRYHAAGVNYDAAKVDLDLGDLVLIPLTVVFSPVMAQTTFAAFALLALAFGAWSLMRAFNSSLSPLLVWILPLSFNVLLVLGFFNFLLVLGMAMACAGWWIQLKVITHSTVLWLFALMVLCLAAHRGGALLLALFILAHEVTFFIRSKDVWRQRWGGLSLNWRRTLFLLCLLVGGYAIRSALFKVPQLETANERNALFELVTLRPLLLLEEGAERWFLIALGALLLATLTLAVHVRWKDRDRLLPIDALAFAALALLLASLLVRTRYADLIYFVERSQLTALMLLAMWSASVLGRTRVTLLLSLLVAVTHIARLNYLEGRMARLSPALEGTLEAMEHLPPHQVVLPVTQDDNWLLAHVSAFAAARYEGVLFSPHDHLRFRFDRPPVRDVLRFAHGRQREMAWLDAHVRKQREPIIPYMVVFGHGAPEDPSLAALHHAMQRYYEPQWKNGYAEVWGLRPH